MNIIARKTKDGAIEFLHHGSIVYDIPPYVRGRGFDYWLDVLRQHGWFAAALEFDFVRVWHSKEGEKDFVLIDALFEAYRCFVLGGGTVDLEDVLEAALVDAVGQENFDVWRNGTIGEEMD